MAIWTQTGYPTNGDYADYADRVASSYDGSVLIGQAGTFGDIFSFYIHVSKDYGQTWNKVPGMGPRQWGPFAVSSSGSIAYTFEAGSGHPWVSVDSGDTWTELTTLPAYGWSGICCSADGSTAYLGNASGLCYKTTDYGATWAETSSDVSNIGFITCSSNGSVVLVSSGFYPNYHLHVSTDGGASWALAKATVGNPFSSGGMDGVGQVMATYCEDQNVWVSHDGGSTWVGTYLGYSSSREVYVSSDGLTILVGGQYSGTYYSYDGGVTWGVDLPNSPLFAVADKSTGTKLLGVKQGQWYTYSGLLPSEPTFYISSISPESGPTAGGTAVTLSGGGFYELQQEEGIWFGDVYAGHGTFIDVNTYTVVAPPAAAAGDIFISVQTTNDYAEYTPFTYTEDTLSVTSITPASGSVEGGTFVTIAGAGFNQATVATLDGLNLTDHTVTSDTTITGVTPPNTAGFKTLSVNRP